MGHLCLCSNLFYSKLFIGGLATSTTTESIRDLFLQFGDISDCVLKTEKSTSKFHYSSYPEKSRGFGFVVFKDSISLGKVLEQLNIVLDGKIIDCKVAVPFAKEAKRPVKMHKNPRRNPQSS